MGAGVAFGEIVLQRSLPFDRMAHCHGAEEQGGDHNGQGEEEHSLIRGQRADAAESGSGALDHETVEEGEADTGDQGEDDTCLGALLLASGKLAVRNAAEDHGRDGQHDADPEHGFVAGEAGAEVVEDDTAYPAEAAADRETDSHARNAVGSGQEDVGEVPDQASEQRPEDGLPGDVLEQVSAVEGQQAEDCRQEETGDVVPVEEEGLPFLLLDEFLGVGPGAPAYTAVYAADHGQCDVGYEYHIMVRF